MDGAVLGTQFCLELAFGVLLALAFVPRAPVGVFFYRLMGAAVLAPAVGALVLLRSGGADWLSPPVLCLAPIVLAWPFYARQPRDRTWWVAIGLAMLGAAAGLFVLLRAGDVGGGSRVALATASALATGAVAGSVGLAMVLGHWYLTVPKLQVAHLRRLNRVTVGSMVVCLLLVGLSLLVFADSLGGGERSIYGPWGLFHLGTRVAVGLLLPLVFAWMAHDSLRFENTRSATGILYASTVLVLIGTAVAISLQSSYGVPL